MAQLNEWLSINKTSGTGNAEITLTASSYEDLVERTATIKVQGINTNAILTVRQEAFIPSFSVQPNPIYLTSYGTEVEITIVGNTDWEIIADEWVTISDKYGYVSGEPITKTIKIGAVENMGDARQGTLKIKSLATDTVFKTINILQEPFNVEDYVQLVYETKTDNELLYLFLQSPYGYLTSTFTNGANSNKVQTIIIDGVIYRPSDESPLKDGFTIPNKGEHNVLIRFTDNTIWESVTSNNEPAFYENTRLKSIVIPPHYQIRENSHKYGLFIGCSSLQSVNMNGVLSYIASTSSYVSSTFDGCTSLETVLNFRLQDGVIRQGLCSDNPNLKTFTIYNNEIPKTVEAWAFNNCKNLHNDFLVNYIHNKGVGSIGMKAFYNCLLFEGENGVLNLEGVTLGDESFGNCVKLKTVYANYGYDAFTNCGETLYMTSENAWGIENSTFKKVVCLQLLNPISTNWFSSPYLEEIEFMAEEQQDMRYQSESGRDWDGKFSKTPNLKKITFHSILPPIVNYNTLQDVPYNGTLVYPKGADYSQLLSTDEYYLGYYGWNDIIVPNPYFNLSKTNVTIGKSSTNVAITLETNARWYIETDVSWLSVSQNSGLQGTTNFDIVVSENNTSNTRMGSITIYSETGIEGGKITITQYNEYGDRLLYTSTTKDVVNLEIYTATTAADGSAVSIISNTYDAENDIGTIIFDKDVSYLIAEFENASAITHITLPAMIKKIRYLEVGSVEELKLPPLLESIESLTFRNSRIEKIYFGENFSKINTDCFYIAPREMYFTTLTPPDCRTYSIGMSGYVGGRTTVYVPTEALDAYRGFRTHFYNSQVTITSITS